ncbi:hypothetical protein Tco_0596313 [Tanacetum coccineum]
MGSFQKDEDDDEIFQSCRSNLVDLHIYMLYDGWRWQVLQGLLWWIIMQVLPNVFTETLYTGTPWVYLIYNRGTIHKYVRVNTLHFIRAAPDEYYVKAYHNNRSECNGYNLDLLGYRQRRTLVTLTSMEESPFLPSEFLKHIVNNQVRVMVSNVVASTVTKLRVALSNNRYGHIFAGLGWNIFAVIEHLQVGNRLVLTNLLNNTVSIMPFADSGLGLRVERVPRMPLNALVPFIRSPIDKDKRMAHECVWDNHEEHHVNEDN